MNCSAQEIYTLLHHYDHILVTAHVSPDGDALGSVLAYALAEGGREGCRHGHR